MPARALGADVGDDRRTVRVAVELARQSLRTAVARHLATHESYHCGRWEVSSGDGAAATGLPDVRVVDWPATRGGATVAGDDTAAGDRVSGAAGVVLVLDESACGTDVSVLLRGGDRALVAAAGPLEEIGRAVDAVALGGCWVAPTVQRWLAVWPGAAPESDTVRPGGGATDAVPAGTGAVPELPAAPQDALTPRERDVWRLVVTGMANRDIGALLGVSVYTVRTHVRAVLRKTGCANRHELTVRSLSADGARDGRWRAVGD